MLIRVGIACFIKKNQEQQVTPFRAGGQSKRGPFLMLPFSPFHIAPPNTLTFAAQIFKSGYGF
jgi:hypothetical protein